MSTKTKTVRGKANKTLNKVQFESAEQILASLPNREFVRQNVPLDQIDFNPKNRKVFKPGTIEDLAQDFLIVGVLEDIILRYMPDNRLEVVIGERRTRAAKIANLPDIPSRIYHLTDQEARRIRFSENAKREDLHPMDEANLISEMLQDFPSVDEVAARLGRSKPFVYQRMKLSALISDIQAPFMAGQFELTEALQISSLSPEAQQAFYDKHCKNWQKKELTFLNLEYLIDSFKCSLDDAPFDINDPTIYPEAGACTSCQFNTSCQLLFPDEEVDALCTKIACFEKKSELNLTKTISDALQNESLAGLIVYSDTSEEVVQKLNTVTGVENLQKYNPNDITILEEPTAPTKEEYGAEYGKNEAGEITEDLENFDEDAYNDDLISYQQDLAEFNQLCSQPDAKRGFVVSPTQVSLVTFLPTPPHENSTKFAANGNGPTPQKGNDEDRVQTLQYKIRKLEEDAKNEDRADREKIQKAVHKEFTERVKFQAAKCILTDTDKLIERWVIFNYLTWQNRKVIQDNIGLSDVYSQGNEAILNAVLSLTDEQYCYVLRTVMSSFYNSDHPTSVAGFFLYQHAVGIGVDVASIEDKFKAKADKRKKKLQEELEPLQAELAKLLPSEQTTTEGEMPIIEEVINSEAQHTDTNHEEPSISPDEAHEPLQTPPDDTIQPIVPEKTSVIPNETATVPTQTNIKTTKKHKSTKRHNKPNHTATTDTPSNLSHETPETQDPGIEEQPPIPCDNENSILQENLQNNNLSSDQPTTDHQANVLGEEPPLVETTVNENPEDTTADQQFQEQPQSNTEQ